jgi:hypothetical protein
MSVLRGDVVLAWYPFASGRGGKRRPVVCLPEGGPRVTVIDDLSLVLL